MFKMVTGGNGRIVFCGEVTRTKEGALEIKGADWNPEKKMEEKSVVQMKVAQEMLPTSKDIEVGEKVITTLMPDRKIPNYGLAEEIAKNGNAVAITNDKGNEKIVLIGEVRNKKFNEKRNKLTISFLNIKDVDGGYVGYESHYKDRENKECTAYWLNVSYFNSNKFNNNYDADKADKLIQPGDVVAMVVSRKETTYEGKTYINYNGNKFFVISSKKNKTSAAPQNEIHSNKETQTASQPAQPENIINNSDDMFNNTEDGFEDIGDDYMSIFN